MENLRCDVLVVGGGLAGMVAALEARKHVEKVVLASKAPAGRSGNTIVSGAGFSAYIRADMQEDSEDQFFRDTFDGGLRVGDPRLIGTLAEKAGPALLVLEAVYGVELQRHDGRIVRRQPPGHSFPRSVPTVFSSYPYLVRGLSITRPLAGKLPASGIICLDGYTVTDLAVHEGEICGAYLLDGRGTGLPVSVSAKAVVLAAGGGGRLFSHTNNTNDVAGDSYALALRAGAELRDMEFVQFYPTMGVKPVKVTVSNPLFGHGAVLRNRSGERFMERYDPRGDMATRDAMARAIFWEVAKGNGVDGGVYLDCTGIREDILQKVYPSFVRFLRKQKHDIFNDRLIVYPSTHFFCGGIKIDPLGYTRVPGLFAAGEAAGGMHGANRLSGNALSEALVFGFCAGEGAGKYAAIKSGSLPELPAPPLPQLNIKGDISPDEVCGALRRTLWQDVSLVRDQRSLERARLVIMDCEKSLADCRTRDQREIQR
ncbi:MAG: FAD-dependent oxidoreductase, partial [Eubacteriales bacterium]